MQASRKIINVVTRDASKAFNKVWHEGLIYKIQTQYQLPPLTIKLLSTFLKQRTARIKINEYEGPAFDIEIGVPQGSVLGQTLCSLYTNDTPELNKPNINVC